MLWARQKIGGSGQNGRVGERGGQVSVGQSKEGEKRKKEKGG